MECPPTCSAWCEASHSVDDNALQMTSDSISNKSRACEGSMEVWCFSFFYGSSFFFIVPVYLQSVQVHSVNWFKEVDECL
jgi:hypothetical protein